MKQSLVRLILCCNAVLATAGAFAGVEQSAPWLQREDITKKPEPLRTAPARNLSDFTRLAPNQQPWMLEDMLDRIREASPVGEKDTTAQDFDMQVFISAGMPDGVLRSLFAQAMEFPAGRVRFVVRGFTPQKLGVLISRLRGLFPEPTTEHISLEIDPNAFRAYEVESVPVYLVKDGEKWFETMGAQSLFAAKENVKERGKKQHGELYAIAEPDMLSVIEDRVKNYDWEPVMARAQARAAQNLKPGFDLPTATQDTTSYFVPTFKVPYDITSPGRDGKGQILLAKGGSVINLLEHTRLQVPVIVFDPSDQRQARMVKSWLTKPEYANADLFVVGFNLQALDAKTPVTVEIARSYKRPVFPWLAKLNERFGVQSVPSIVQQEGQRLRINTFKPENF